MTKYKINPSHSDFSRSYLQLFCGVWELLRRHQGRRASFNDLICPNLAANLAGCASAFSERITLSTRNSNVKWCLPYASSVVTHVPRCTRPSLRFRYLGSKVMRNIMHVESGGRAWERGYYISTSRCLAIASYEVFLNARRAGLSPNRSRNAQSRRKSKSTMAWHAHAHIRPVLQKISLIFRNSTRGSPRAR